MKGKKKIEQNILVLLIVTMITIFVWAGLSIYRSFTKSTAPEVLKEQIEPLDPNFDLETLGSLKERKTFSEEELESIPEITEFSLKEEEIATSPAVMLEEEIATSPAVLGE